MKILYLYSEVMGYTLSTIKHLSNLNNDVHVVHWDSKGKRTPYKFDRDKKIKFYSRSKLNFKKLYNLYLEIKPNIIVVSGWMDILYLLVCFNISKSNIKIVCCIDQQWQGGMKQRIISFLSFFGIFKFFFTHAWVPGIYNFEYARRLNFKKNKIIFDLYSADSNIFNNQYHKYKLKKEKKYPHKFLFVGRFEKVKAIDVLVNSWDLLKDDKKDWKLCLIGDGSLKNDYHDRDDIEIFNFMSPDKLIKIIPECGCFIIPSRNEPWGVVINEFLAAGLPVISSDVCGASANFLISGYNGYTFKTDDKFSLLDKLKNIANKSDKELNIMSRNSYELSKRISPKTSAYNLLSIMNN